MPDLKTAHRDLKALYAALFKAETSRSSNVDSLASDEVKQKMDRMLAQQIDELQGLIESALLELLSFPPHHAGHFQTIFSKPFQELCPNGKAVFIMTKFPDKKDAAKDEQLRKVIKTVQDAVVACGFKPAIASQKDFEPLLWSNVETYLLGCCRGVVILEDKFKQEFNPNVAMEWGWMRAMGKPVLYLKEAGFNHDRADISGLTTYDFNWDSPVEIEEHITRFLL